MRKTLGAGRMMIAHRTAIVLIGVGLVASFCSDEAVSSNPAQFGEGFATQAANDCNSNGIDDANDISAGTSVDCNGNAIPDECDLSSGTSDDCNANTVIDGCESVGPLNVVKLLAPDGAAYDRFGNSISINGDTMVVGALGHELEEEVGGSAYVFQNSNGAWKQIAKIKADVPEVGDFFGARVVLVGNTLAVAAGGYDGPVENSGAVFIFEKNAGEWEQVARLIPNEVVREGYLGSVALTDDTLLVGLHDAELAGKHSGAAFVFERVNGSWQQVATLTASDASPGDHFGVAVALQGDVAVIGANYEAGVYVFRKIIGTWVEVTKLLESQVSSNILYDQRIIIHNDQLLVGITTDDEWGYDAGAVYAFREINGDWQEFAKITPADIEGGDKFGGVMALKDDLVLFGVPRIAVSPQGTGAAYLFKLTADRFQQVARITAFDGAHLDSFGSSVALTTESAFIGALHDDDLGLESGSIYIYDLDLPMTDCNGNAIPDECDMAEFTSFDCNGNSVPDECEQPRRQFIDCNSNAVPDECDVAGGTSSDCDDNVVPDECDPDFNSNGLIDGCDPDIDGDGVLNAMDVCDYSVLGLPVTPWGAPKGDIDDDCTATVADHLYFEICLSISGPDFEPFFSDCVGAFDFDGDDDVDLADFAGFTRVVE